MAEGPKQIMLCEIPHENIEEEIACEALFLANIPDCPGCGPHQIESHPIYSRVRCANCKEWLA